VSQPDPVAGLVLAGFEGHSADSEEIASLADLGVGGFILFARNVDSPLQVHTLLNGLRRQCPTRELLLAVDQEGGRVARLRSPLTVWPPMAELGATEDEDLARQVGKAMGAELRVLGFNVNFAPVLDVLCEETTIAIGDRSLGADPLHVARLGSALIEGLQSAGIIACGKHFPGHGHVAEDSHHELPICPLSEDRWRSDHLPPFSAAIKAGVISMMTAHVVYPGLGVHTAATLSSRIMTDLLRSELGFEGVLFSDDLGMGAITKNGNVGEAAVAAVRAGVDGLLVCRNLSAVTEVVASLRTTAEADRDFADRCMESLDRLRAAAQRHPSTPSPAARLPMLLGPLSHQTLAARLKQVAVTADPTLGHDDPSESTVRDDGQQQET
jgi:beta-N-acetylhexosaminidase